MFIVSIVFSLNRYACSCSPALWLLFVTLFKNNDSIKKCENWNINGTSQFSDIEWWIHWFSTIFNVNSKLSMAKVTWPDCLNESGCGHHHVESINTNNNKTNWLYCLFCCYCAYHFFLVFFWLCFHYWVISSVGV